MTPYTHINTNIWIWIDCCVGSGCEVNIATRVYKMPPSLCSLCFTVKVYENKSQIPTKECHLIILDKKENKHIFVQKDLDGSCYILFRLCVVA